jgi:hypothetical protein
MKTKEQNVSEQLVFFIPVNAAAPSDSAIPAIGNNEVAGIAVSSNNH